jgi:hypothetical protein
VAAVFVFGAMAVGSGVNARTGQIPARTRAQAQHAVHVITASQEKKKEKKHHKSSGPKVYAVGQTMTNGADQKVTVTAFAQGVAAGRIRPQALAINASGCKWSCSTEIRHRGISRCMN